MAGVPYVGTANTVKRQQLKYTIYDVAREAGVSAKTVSRVLNRKAGVGKETRARILDIMQKVGYHPHMGARSLRGNERRGSIGVTMPAPLDVIPISQGMLLWLFAQLLRIFGPLGDYVCFDMNPHEANSHSDYGRGVWEQLFKACIIAGALPVDDPVVQRIHESGVPYLAFGRLDRLPDCSSATVDYEEGAYISTKFLIDRGHRSIAMLKAFSGFQPGIERIRGYRHALDEAGIAYDERLVRSVNFGASNIASVVHRLLVDRSVTALVDCSATEDASSLREGARRAGRVPGEDFEIVAWTYAHDAAVLREASAHLWMPLREACTEGLEQLAAWTHGERAGPIKLLYRPILQEAVAKGEVPRPGRIFDLFE